MSVRIAQSAAACIPLVVSMGCKWSRRATVQTASMLSCMCKCRGFFWARPECSFYLTTLLP